MSSIAMEYKDLQATALGIDCSNDYAILVGRKNVAVLDLKSTEIIQKYPRTTKWEITAMECSLRDPLLCAIATVQKVEICSLKDDEYKILTDLKGHARIICDLAWSPFNSNNFGTCSSDAHTFIWDLLSPNKPINTLVTYAATSQIQWNKKIEHLVATAHDGGVKIWDLRTKNNVPANNLAAHVGKIHGLDWNFTNERQLATCSQDASIEMWDFKQPKQPLVRIQCGHPVWRAKYTPLGDGILSVVVSQLRRENSLLLWNIQDYIQPVHSFIGHKDVVLNFHWRKLLEKTELITWSKDQMLHIWDVDKYLHKLAGYESPTEEIEDLNVTLSSKSSVSGTVSTNNIPVTSKTQTISSNRDSFLPTKLQLLTQEFDLTNFSDLDNLEVIEMNPENGSCTISASSSETKKTVVTLEINFPDNYPNTFSPIFEFIEVTTLSDDAKERLMTGLIQTAEQQVRHKRPCFESCVRKFTEFVKKEEQIETQSDTNQSFPLSLSPSPYYYRRPFIGVQDNRVPFPRFSGARFSSTGFLITFSNPFFRRNEDGTPKSLDIFRRMQSDIHSASVPYFNRSSPTEHTYHYLYKTKTDPWLSKQRIRSKPRLNENGVEINKNKRSMIVVVYDFSSVMPANKQLAEHYSMNRSNIVKTCNHNATAAANAGRKDLYQMWKILSVTLSENKKNEINFEDNWSVHPMGHEMIKSLLQHYFKLGDVQTVAMISTITTPLPAELENKLLNKNVIEDTNHISNSHSKTSCIKKMSSNHKSDNAIEYNPYHTIHPSDTTLKGWNIKIQPVVKRSNSLDEFSLSEIQCTESNGTISEYEDNSYNSYSKKRIEEWEEYLRSFDGMKLMYSEVLFKWKLLCQRAAVLKTIQRKPVDKYLEFNCQCPFCGDFMKGEKHRSSQCDKRLLKCSICLLSVKGLAVYCIECGHGGHLNHIESWFRTRKKCPTGCDCDCFLKNTCSDMISISSTN